MGILLFVIIVLLFAINVIPKLFSKNKAAIWSPVTFLCVYLSYYVLVPYFKGGTDASEDGQLYLLFGTLLFYIVFRSVFKHSKPKHNLTAFNNAIDTNNATKVALWLFGIAFVGYGIINGFSLSVLSASSREELTFNENGSYGHSEMYITYLISVFTFSCALIYAAKNKLTPLFYIIVCLTVIIYIIGGFRYRILILLVAVSTVVYLYPRPKKIKYYFLIPLAIVVYLAMGVIEATRMYGKGLNAQALIELQKTGQVKEASENMMVFEFSAECMEKYNIDDLILFEPIITAVCMPIPRGLFPEKPKGIYMREANMKIYGTIEYGNAFLNITEAYISFWWFGIIAYAAFLGWLSKLFWNNYLRNPMSMGAIVLLGLYNATLYQIIARGYMAQTLTTFIYYMFIPYWLLFLLRKLKFLKF